MQLAASKSGGPRKAHYSPFPGSHLYRSLGDLPYHSLCPTQSPSQVWLGSSLQPRSLHGRISEGPPMGSSEGKGWGAALRLRDHSALPICVQAVKTHHVTCWFLSSLLSVPRYPTSCRDDPQPFGVGWAGWSLPRVRRAG